MVDVGIGAEGDPGMESAAGSLRMLRLAVGLVYRSGRWQLTFVAVSALLTSLMVAGQLLVGRTLLDLIAEPDGVDAGELAPYLLLFGAMMVLSAVSQAAAGEVRLLLGEKVHRRTMDDILDVATEVELEAYEGAEFHDRLQRARMAAGGQSAAVVFGLVTLVSTLLVTIGVVGVLITVAPVLLPVALVGYLPIAYVNVRNTRARYRMEHDLTELYRDRSYLEYLMTERSNAKEVRAYGVAPTLRTWHGQIWDVRMERLRALVRRRLALTTAGSLVTTTAMVATFSIALILAGRGSITIGDAAVAIVGLQQLSGRLQTAAGALNGVHDGMTFLQDFDIFRATLPVIREARPTRVPPTPPSVLTVEHVGYRYPGASSDAVRDVSFEVRRGQIVAIVGANGSGKTTLTKLVCDLLAPARGTVSWDGVDVAVCDPELVRAQIAPTFQDYATFMLTIRRAVGLGDVDRLDDSKGIERAIYEVGLDGLLESLPDGLDTRLGKAFSGGVDVSVGQWQRLAIARALFRDAPVVVLDEPSASLDPRAEADLFDLLQKLCHDRIVLFVSHRFATVRSADNVVVLDQGEVVEIGPHDELMAAGGLYRELFDLQAHRYGLTS